MCWEPEVGTVPSPVSSGKYTRWDGPCHGAAQHRSSFPSPGKSNALPQPLSRGLRTPQVPSPPSSPLAITRRMPKHTVPAHEDAGTQDNNVTLAPGTSAWGGMAGGILSLPCQPRSRLPPCPGLRGCRRGKQARVQAAGQKHLAPSQCHRAREQASSLASGGRRGTASAGQPGEEEDAVAPSRSPERRCYIYRSAGPGLCFSPVTQAPQPARIRGDGTFLSKNNPPAAGERAGVEVTDWTAAPTAPLARQQPSRSAAPGDGHPARVAIAPAPCPGGWGQSWEPESPAAARGPAPVPSPRPGNGHSPRACGSLGMGGCAASPPAVPAGYRHPEGQVQPRPPCSAQPWGPVPVPAETSAHGGTGQAALQRQPPRWHSRAWCPPHSGARQPGLEPCLIPGSSEMLLCPGAEQTARGSKGKLRQPQRVPRKGGDGKGRLSVLFSP